MRKIQVDFGGHLYQRPHKKNPHWKPFSNIIWYQGAAATLLRAVRPYLRLKAPQADLALEFMDFMQLPRKQRCVPLAGVGNGNIYVRTPETLARELEFKERMHALNRKGVPDAKFRSDGEVQARDAA